MIVKGQWNSRGSMSSRNQSRHGNKQVVEFYAMLGRNKDQDPDTDD